MKVTIWKVIKRSLLLLLIVGTIFIVNLLWFKPFSINHFYNKIFIEFALENPQMISSMGYKFYSDELNDNSQDAKARSLALLKKDYSMLHDYDNSNFTGQDAISYDVLDAFLKEQIANLEFEDYGYSQSQKGGNYLGIISFMSNIHRIDDVSDAQDYISRLSQIGTSFDNTIIQVKKEQSNGVIPPDFIIKKMLTNMHNIRDPKLSDNELVKDFISKLDKLENLDQDSKDKLQKDMMMQMEQVVQPAYDRMIAFYQDLLTKADSRAGVWKFPNGSEYYQHQVKTSTTTDYTPQYLHNLGLQEVDRIVAEINSILIDQGYDTNAQTIGKILNDMSKEPRFLYPDSDDGRIQVIADYQKIIDEIGVEIDGYFGILPEGKVLVKKVPEYKEKTAAGGYYERPSMDGSRPGIFYANLYDLSATPKFGMRTLAYHEAIPGHHFQLAIQNELKGLPMFRGFMHSTGYTEGWALYAERFAWEIGFQKDPFSNIGRLQAELLRAVRLVVDTGIHYGKWSREQAIKYMSDTTGFADSDVESEIERYIVWPGQALAYKVGMIKILELREKAKNQLGDKFDIRDFHTHVLRNGSLPLTMLEEQIDAYIDQES
ncbi:MAG: DUF885 domain-containing protein [Proteobacteria bacterium]|nr:DUF885 domain-containing protein [Pseudomonadota bacterium]